MDKTNQKNIISLIGTMHGKMANHLPDEFIFEQTPTNFEGSAKELGEVVMLSDAEELTESNKFLPLLKSAFDIGKIVALEHVNTNEINHLLKELNLDIVFPNQEDNSSIELFAARKMNDGNHFFVTQDNDENESYSHEDTEYTYTIIGPEDKPTNIEKTEKTTKDKVLNESNDILQKTRVANFATWVQEQNTKQANKSETSSTELHDLAEANVWDVDKSDDGQSFTIRYIQYSCHSFTNGMDYYFISQSAQLNPSVLWKWIEKGHVSYPNIYLPKQEGHMRRYLFKNYWGEDPGNNVPLEKTSPENANDKTTITSGISYSLSGSLGFNGNGPTGSLTAGATFNNSQSFSLSDCSVNNMSGSEGKKHLAAWEYSFADPANGSTEFYYTELKDAPLLSRSNFQPVNQWIWTVPRSFTDKWSNFRFKSEFTWTNGRSEGQMNCCWIKVQGATHKDKHWHYHGFWVPVKKPPLLAVSIGQIDFTKAGESQSAILVSAVDWTAKTDADWLSVQETSGRKTDANGIYIHITASPNTSGANRTATVTLNGTGGQKQIIKVFQSQY